ncbi:helix-turn-helix domain-containing protein [Acetobacter senegalensis]|uniref:transcriptional regulator n=1 Tax=Acetobacter senegalensis TaxID=446692 RepID=UPI0038CF6F53|nr:helix-turn-helix domain-containing protein [Acetobacter senegalensis]
MENNALKRVIEVVGGVAPLASLLGIKPPSIYSWKEIPPKRVVRIAEITGIPASELRPDLYPRALSPSNGKEAA